jgi:riboflavin kinase/FMN adenylyltransferase
MPSPTLIRDWDRGTPDVVGATVAIGNFDGVHRGHQAVIGEALRAARAAGRPGGVLTFEPHPRRFFKPDGLPFLLTRLRTKLRIIAGLGATVVYALRFNARLAALDAETFVDEVLVGGLGVAEAVVGYDFVFGRGRRGSPELLRERLAHHGRLCRIMPPVAAASLEAEEGMIYSSTGVRDALVAGDPVAAAAILGRPFEIEGHVRHGDQRGRLIGFPTANIELGDYLRPRLGVYAVRVRIGRDPLVRDGVANLGMRPTVGGTAPRLEVHLFDFAGDLYGRQLAVALSQFIRPEIKFPGLDALKVQIAEDAARARDWLAAPPRPPRSVP